MGRTGNSPDVASTGLFDNEELPMPPTGMIALSADRAPKPPVKAMPDAPPAGQIESLQIERADSGGFIVTAVMSPSKSGDGLTMEKPATKVFPDLAGVLSYAQEALGGPADAPPEAPAADAEALSPSLANAEPSSMPPAMDRETA